VKDLLMNYWWIGASFSALYTAGSVWWTITAERRFRKLQLENRVLDLALESVRNDVLSMQAFLENGNTLRSIRLVPPIVQDNDNDEKRGA